MRADASAPRPLPPALSAAANPEGIHDLRTVHSSSEENTLASGPYGSALRFAPSPQENSSWSLQRLQDYMPSVQAWYKDYEDAFVKKFKDQLMIARDHPTETFGVVVAAGFVLMQGPRRFLVRNTIGRLLSEQDRSAKAELCLKELSQSVDKLKKDSKNMLLKASWGEQDLQRGHTKIRAAGREIQRLANSIYKIESEAADLMDGLRALPGRTALQLRAEVASMASDLKTQRRELNKRIMKISELGIRV
ncbi:RGS1-HXK1-interacting protein 1 [Phoenix dactylifera]|uniref:RGS1-HXK1-interacting protein 1 n=1 Tax=Phoenix dactylifera TaxID=42345 RepID=A0A8B7BLU3_PHODC|nr:RGS1-HXK1-interacting protein 1 [Phoenix dactylifera]